MIKLTELKEYFDAIAAKYAMDPIYVVLEEHLKKALNGKPGLIMAVVYPSHHVTGVADNTWDENICIVYLLEYTSKPNSTQESEFQSYAAMQGIADEIKDKLIADADSNHRLLLHLNRESIEIEPEWNVAGGYNGYSVGFSFKR